MNPTMLPGLLSLVVATVSDDGSFVTNDRQIYGLSNAALFDLLWGDNDVLCGMTFDQATIKDPRRIVARMQQSLLQIMKQAFRYRMDASVHEEIARRAFLTGMDGKWNDLPGMAQSFHDSVEAIEAILSGLSRQKEGDSQATAILLALEGHREDIERSLREGLEVALRAADVSGDEWKACWYQMADAMKRLEAKIGEREFFAGDGQVSESGALASMARAIGGGA